MRKLIILLFVTTSIMSCDPDSAFTCCTYQYPINAIGLSDTIKTTDTIWIDNDLDARLCWGGIYRNGKGEESPYFYKFESDTFERVRPTLIYNDSTYIFDGVFYDYQIAMKYEGGKYQSKYGIVFPEPGIYSMSSFGCAIANGIDNSISLSGYFDVVDNNQSILPANVKIPTSNIGSSGKYKIYFLRVIE
jgi:hypothetical protein